MIVINNNIKAYDSYINKYKLRNKDDDRLLEMFLDIYQQSLNDNAKFIISWYKEVIEQIKYLSEKKPNL